MDLGQRTGNTIDDQTFPRSKIIMKFKQGDQVMIGKDIYTVAHSSYMSSHRYYVIKDGKGYHVDDSVMKPVIEPQKGKHIHAK